jgi:4-amino-4-deoxy-L-arabinose transferase-like glycosyltransferase
MNGEEIKNKFVIILVGLLVLFLLIYPASKTNLQNSGLTSILLLSLIFVAFIKLFIVQMDFSDASELIQAIFGWFLIILSADLILDYNASETSMSTNSLGYLIMGTLTGMPILVKFIITYVVLPSLMLTISYILLRRNIP